MNKILLTILLTPFLLAQNSDIAYVKYFKTLNDYNIKKSIMATERRGISHIQVSYNEKDQSVLIEHISPSGFTAERQALEYMDGKLIRKGTINHKNEYLDLIDFSDTEPWSKEFIDWWIQGNNTLSVDGQQTRFFIPNGKQVSKIQFETINGVKYGQVELDYDYLGFLKEERWRDLISGNVIRRFHYKFDVMTNVNQIWEYGRDGELISHMSLAMAPADQLYKEPPPRTGNTLSESEIIMKEIKEKRIIVPHGGIIPRTELDEIIFKSGQRMEVEFISLEEGGIQFKLSGTGDLLTVPKTRVESLTSRNGTVIYPEPIRNAKY